MKGAVHDMSATLNCSSSPHIEIKGSYRCGSRPDLMFFRGFRSIGSMLLTANPIAASSISLCSPFPLYSLKCSVRQAASFPMPRISNARKGPQKTFNFLTHERLVTSPVAPTQAAMKKENVYQAKLTHFREELLEKIEKYVQYYPKEVSDFVFHAIVQERPQAKTFTGHRQLAAPTFTRIQLLVLHELIKGKNREKLIQLMEKAHVTVPSKTLWESLTDKKTGDITCGLVYSKYVQKALRRLAVGRERGYLNVPCAHFYIGLNFFDKEKVPSLSEWWHRMGPVTKKDLVFSRSFAAHKRLIHQGKEEVMNYAKAEVDAALLALSPEDTEQLIKDFKRQSVSIMRRIEQHHVFTQSVLVAVGSLPEIRVIQGPKHSFQSEYNGMWYIQQGGAYYPDPKGGDKAWLQLSQEDKQKYLPFGTKPTGTRSGVQAFLKYCQRDYGLSMEEARERLAELSEVQMAAMNFPFHVTLFSEKNPVQRPFRRFLKEKLMEYGLLRSSKGDDGLRFHSNRLFTAMMRVKWMNMTAEERRAFEEEDIANVFPLQPTKHLSDSSGGEEGSQCSRILWSSLLQDKVTDEDSQRYLEEFGRRSKQLIQLQEEQEARKEQMAEEEKRGRKGGTPLQKSASPSSLHEDSDTSAKRKRGRAENARAEESTLNNGRRKGLVAAAEKDAAVHQKKNTHDPEKENFSYDRSSEACSPSLKNAPNGKGWLNITVDMRELELPEDENIEE